MQRDYAPMGTYNRYHAHSAVMTGHRAATSDLSTLWSICIGIFLLAASTYLQWFHTGGMFASPLYTTIPVSIVAAFHLLLCLPSWNKSQHIFDTNLFFSFFPEVMAAGFMASYGYSEYVAGEVPNAFQKLIDDLSNLFSDQFFNIAWDNFDVCLLIVAGNLSRTLALWGQLGLKHPVRSNFGFALSLLITVGIVGLCAIVCGGLGIPPLTSLNWFEAESGNSVLRYSGIIGRFGAAPVALLSFYRLANIKALNFVLSMTVLFNAIMAILFLLDHYAIDNFIFKEGDESGVVLMCCWISSAVAIFLVFVISLIGHPLPKNLRIYNTGNGVNLYDAYHRPMLV